MSRKILLLILGLAALVNLAGIFGPEIGFDALWYHLTIPKLYLLAGRIYHIPGGLLYYSEMPRLTEVLYIPLLKYLGDIGPHLVSWGAGIGSAIIVYKLARKIGLSSVFSLLSCVIFYVTPLVSWQSGSAYVDLTRSFFEILALYLVISEKPILAGLTVGLAISVKTLAIGSVFPLGFAAIFIFRNHRSIIYFLISAFLTGFPWYLSSFLNTGFPFYPIGAGILDATHKLNSDIWNIPKMLADYWKLWLLPEDPISPIYLIILPFLWPAIKNRKFIVLLSYCLLSYFIWYITPRTGGGRFILPYLPAFAVLSAAVISEQKEKLIRQILIWTVIAISVINLGYRLVVIARLTPYFTGRETKMAYLCRNLNPKDTFLDCAGWFQLNIKPNDVILVDGIHNLYYVNFPFIDRSWHRGEPYTYKLVP